MPRYGIATLLGNYQTGYEFTPDNIPLHLTHIDSFEVELTIDALTEKLKEALLEQKEFSTEATVDTFLGPNKDIPVTMLQLTPELIHLHAILLDCLKSMDASLKNPHFHGKEYGPHISIYENRRITPGEQIYIKNISIGTKVGEGKDALHRIIATIEFN